MMTDRNNTTDEYSAPYHHCGIPPTPPVTSHYYSPQTPRRQNKQMITTATTPTSTTTSTIGGKTKKKQHTRKDGSSSLSSALLWVLPPPPPSPSTPKTPAMDNYYAMFGAEILIQQQQQQQDNNDDKEEGRPLPTTARRSYLLVFTGVVNMVYNFCYWYSTQMDTYPVRTKSITGGCASIVGDIIAQIFTTNYYEMIIYWNRVLAMFCCGLTFGPMLHYTYELYEYILPIDSCIGIDEITVDAKNCGDGPDNNTTGRGGHGCTTTTTTTTTTNGNSFDYYDQSSIMQESSMQDSKNEGGGGGGGTIDTTTIPPSALLNIYNSIEEPAVLSFSSFLDNNDNVPPMLSSTMDATIPTTPTPTSTTYFCHSTMFHSYYTISHRKYVNAFLHVVIDQGIMQIFYVAVMMLITGLFEGRISTLATTFQEDYITNIHCVWFAALTVLGPIQMICFRFLSLKWRALSVSILDVLEVTIMSCIAHRNVV